MVFGLFCQGPAPENPAPKARNGGPMTTAERIMAAQGQAMPSNSKQDLGPSRGAQPGSPAQQQSRPKPEPPPAKQQKHVVIQQADVRTVAFKGNSPAKASLFNKLKHLADSSFTSGRTNSIQKAGQPGSKTQSRSASNAASKANSQVGSRAGSIGSRRDEYDVDEDDDDLEGFIYEDESTSEDEREDYVNAFGRKKKHRNHNDDFSDYEGAGVRALTAGGRTANIKRAARARKRSEDDNGESSADESDTEEQTIRRLRREAREKREMAEALAAERGGSVTKPAQVQPPKSAFRPKAPAPWAAAHGSVSRSNSINMSPTGKDGLPGSGGGASSHSSPQKVRMEAPAKAEPHIPPALALRQRLEAERLKQEQRPKRLDGRDVEDSGNESYGGSGAPSPLQAAAAARAQQQQPAARKQQLLAAPGARQGYGPEGGVAAAAVAAATPLSVTGGHYQPQQQQRSPLRNLPNRMKSLDVIRMGGTTEEAQAAALEMLQDDSITPKGKGTSLRPLEHRANSRSQVLDPSSQQQRQQPLSPVGPSYPMPPPDERLTSGPRRRVVVQVQEGQASGDDHTSQRPYQQQPIPPMPPSQQQYGSSGGSTPAPAPPPAARTGPAPPPVRQGPYMAGASPAGSSSSLCGDALEQLQELQRRRQERQQLRQQNSMQLQSQGSRQSRDPGSSQLQQSLEQYQQGQGQHRQVGEVRFQGLAPVRKPSIHPEDAAGQAAALLREMPSRKGSLGDALLALAGGHAPAGGHASVRRRMPSKAVSGADFDVDEVLGTFAPGEEEPQAPGSCAGAGPGVRGRGAGQGGQGQPVAENRCSGNGAYAGVAPGGRGSPQGQGAMQGQVGGSARPPLRREEGEGVSVRAIRAVHSDFMAMRSSGVAEDVDVAARTASLPNGNAVGKRPSNMGGGSLGTGRPSEANGLGPGAGASNGSGGAVRTSETNGFGPRQSETNGYGPRQSETNGYGPRQSETNGYGPRQSETNGFGLRHSETNTGRQSETNGAWGGVPAVATSRFARLGANMVGSDGGAPPPPASGPWATGGRPVPGAQVSGSFSNSPAAGNSPARLPRASGNGGGGLDGGGGGGYVGSFSSSPGFGSHQEGSAGAFGKQAMGPGDPSGFMPAVSYKAPAPAPRGSENGYGPSRFAALQHSQLQQAAAGGAGSGPGGPGAPLRASMPMVPSQRDYDSDSALNARNAVGGRTSWNGAHGPVPQPGGAARTRFAQMNMVGA